MSSVADTPDSVKEAPEPVDLDSVRAVAATPGAGVSETRYGRTGAEKTKALDAATEKTGNVDSRKTIYELAAGNRDEVAAAIQQIAYVLERHFNIDFIREAPLAEVTSGLAAARAAMSGTNEKPHEVDDRIIPPGVNNPTDDVLPPNIPAGDPIPGTDRRPGVGDSGPVADGSDAGDQPAEPPAKSATREEWDSYASSVGLDPNDYASKDELQDAVDKKTQG